MQIIVTAHCLPSSKRFSCPYDGDICCGELIRNLCVNLGIDPDTCDGVTGNVTVHLKHSTSDIISVDEGFGAVNRQDYKEWKYRPRERISKFAVDGCLTLCIYIKD
jgi:hypothetical protein